ncbi:esterase-like activity of phytase family protein [Spirochaeta cellobiosiphila]|uniref:esterase-like activity of phytase family protein n=1 Tax=Spirochaeta cellobiosiphila TaxID=504483 RepID=UPI000427B383|nr:esterase-like activity of phytase family protein [Spirochaeta cellobiosiphila]
MKALFLILIVISSLLFSCRTSNQIDPSSIHSDGVILPYSVLNTLPNGTEIRKGGYGSAATAHPSKSNYFYALTDRGPNVTYIGKAGKGKKFPVPDYTPRIGLFQLRKDGTVILKKEILLKDPNGVPITGIPNPEGRGSTGEIPYDNQGNILSFDDYGLDGEGLVALKNGEFWISDEYGPHLVHYNKNGFEIERISPIGVNTGYRHLPAVFAKRRANRGMEGLTITPDKSTLVGIMQSTLYNPNKKGVTNNTVIRIVTFNLATSETKQYLYKQDKPWNSNSEIESISDTEFLVVERDGAFSGEKEAQKLIYKIDISHATDISSSDANDPNGLLIQGKTIEECSYEDLKAAGIKFVSKELVIDLVKELPNHYPHDKLEGIWIMDDNTIAVLNDDDFAVTVNGGEVVQKYLPGTNLVDGDVLYILPLNKSIN